MSSREIKAKTETDRETNKILVSIGGFGFGFYVLSVALVPI